MSHEDEPDSVPLGVKFLICFLIADAARRVFDLTSPPTDPNGPATPIFILWIVLDVLLATLLILRTRAGRYWTQAIFIVHVFYLAHELVVRAPHLWLAMGTLGRGRAVATIFLEGAFVAYLASDRAREHLQDGY